MGVGRTRCVAKKGWIPPNSTQSAGGQAAGPTRLCSLRAGHKEKLAALLDLESSKRTSSGPGSPNSRNSGSSRNSGRDEGQEELAVDQACPDTGTTPLIAASKAGACGCISLLIDNGANINKANHKGWTPLMAAARYGGRNAVRILIMHKADATAELGGIGLTAVDLALQAP